MKNGALCLDFGGMFPGAHVFVYRVFVLHPRQAANLFTFPKQSQIVIPIRSNRKSRVQAAMCKQSLAPPKKSSMAHKTTFITHHENMPDGALAHFATMSNDAAPQFLPPAIHIQRVSTDSNALRMRKQKLHSLFDRIRNIKIVAGLNAGDVTRRKLHPLVRGINFALVRL